MRRSVINIPYQNNIHRSVQVPVDQLERLKKSNAIQKHDLIWISETQDAYLEWSKYYCMDTNTLNIPSTLALVTEVYYDDVGCIWTLLVNDRVYFDDYNVLYTVGVHISDVVANHTHELRKIKAASIIQKYYKRHYFTRNLMAKRIQRTYIQHYWNPTNPNMIQRLNKEYHSLCTELLSCHVP